MRYISTNIKRVFIVRFDDSDDLIDGIKSIAKKENIKAGIFLFLGGMKEGYIVAGPEKISFPPIPIEKNFNDGREIFGIGSICWNENEPKIHIHAGFGRNDNVLLGCLRKNANVYLVIECVIFEFDAKIEKRFSPELGIDIINFMQ